MLLLLPVLWRPLAKLRLNIAKWHNWASNDGARVIYRISEVELPPANYDCCSLLGAAGHLGTASPLSGATLNISI